LLAIYERMDEAAATVSAIIAAKIIPCTMEFLDRTTIRTNGMGMKSTEFTQL
jgi:glycolate oxidase